MSAFFDGLDSASLQLGGGVVLLLLSLLWWLSTRRPPGLPPGPGSALPLLGHLHLLNSGGGDPRAQLKAWAGQYGDVYSVYLGGKLVVVLASYAAIREALVTFGEVFSHRPHVFMVDIATKNQGLSFTSGAKWKEQRKTVIEILRALGMGRDVLASKVQEEVSHYIRAVRDHQGAPVDLSRMTRISVSNNICSILFGRRYDYHDLQFSSLVESIERSSELKTGTGVLNFLPFLRFLPGDPFKINEVLAIDEVLMDIQREQLAQHQKALKAGGAEGQESEDFVYRYLRHIQKHKASGNVDTTLNEENLVRVMEELFFAGTDTTTSAVRWALLLFLHHPHVQDTCFRHISDVIGTHRPPSISDRPSLPYVEATIFEVLRKGEVLPLSLHHGTACDVNFRGYVIPKDTIVIPCLTSALQDPEIWGDPENFRPERFLGPDGKLTKRKELIPFGIGRRVCLGEPLSRMALFLYLTTLIQHFRFLPEEEGQLPSLEGVLGLIHSPKPYKIRAVPRL